MRKINFVCSVVFAIAMPLMIIILSSNIALRIPGMYTYHFNDSQALDKISYSVESGEMSSSVALYWSKPTSEEFQVYEINGEFKDPIFNSKEQDVMKKMKVILALELLAGVVLLIITLSTYIYLLKNGYLEALRKRFFLGTGLTIILTVVHIVLFARKAFRKWAYAGLIGIELGKKSTLSILLGDPLFKTYLIFSTIIVIFILSVFAYINFKYTKPTRIFY